MEALSRQLERIPILLLCGRSVGHKKGKVSSYLDRVRAKRRRAVFLRSLPPSLPLSLLPNHSPVFPAYPSLPFLLQGFIPPESGYHRMSSIYIPPVYSYALFCGEKSSAAVGGQRKGSRKNILSSLARS